MNKKEIAYYEIRGLLMGVRSKVDDVRINLCSNDIGNIDLTDIRSLLNLVEERSKEFVVNETDDELL